MSELARVNRVAVQTLEDSSFEARFFRTHKHIATVNSKDTTFIPNVDSNKTAQREQFRQWVCDNGTIYGISYDPNDRRVEDYKLPAKYTNDAVLSEASVQLITPDITKWVGEIQGLELVSIEADAITEVTKSGKGTKVDSKYLNGNWAWASIDVVITTKAQDTEGYVTMTVNLVSGQLKKPSSINEGSYSMTGFKTEVLRDLGDLLISKSDKSPSDESKSSDLAISDDAEINKLPSDESKSSDLAISDDAEINKLPDTKEEVQSDNKESEGVKLGEAKKKATRKSKKSETK